VSPLEKYQTSIVSAPMDACGCIGPQNGEPRCPCQMRFIVKRNGRWIQKEVDLGPAPADRPLSSTTSEGEQA
jgi:hypothetical protein